MKKLEIRQGSQFGRFKILQEAAHRGGRRFFSCECSCGVIKDVMLKHLVSGKTQSCGCLLKEIGKTNGDHLSNIRPKPKLGKPMKSFYEYGSYRSMRMRCLDSGYKDYSRWGGRGIAICERWLGVNGFQNFLEDMGERPSRYSIERIDNNGNYCKENCKWASFKEQANNTAWTN